MVNISLVSVALIAGIISFGAARDCTSGFYYCGSSLLSIGNYYDAIEDALHEADKNICASRKRVNNSLFYCLAGNNGDIKYKGYCKKGCKDMGVGKSDKC